MRFFLLPVTALLLAVLLAPLVLWLVLPGDLDYPSLFAAAAVTGLLYLAILTWVPSSPRQDRRPPRGPLPLPWRGPKAKGPIPLFNVPSASEDEERRAKMLREQVARAEAEAALRYQEEALREREAALQRHRAIEEQLTLLVEASVSLNSSLELPAVLAAILKLSRRLIAPEAQVCWRFRPGSEAWRIASSSGLSETFQREILPLLEKGPAPPEVPVAAEDVHQVPLLEERRKTYLKEGIRSLLAVPLRVHGEARGNLVFYHRAPHHFSEVEVRVATALANLAGSALGGAELFETQRQADRRKDEFLVKLAHELRQPLAPLRNALQILGLATSADPALQWPRAILDRQVQQLTRLVDDLLDVTRITRGQVELHKEPVELTALIARAVDQSRPLIDACKHELTVALPPGPVRLEADAERLVQVLSNLLSNAVKYTAEGGRIGLAAERQGGEVVLRVWDTGVGISPELLGSVFDLFRPGQGALHQTSGGLGIGLTLVRRLVEMHGGSVQARSDGLGKGSEFVVRLPALPEEIP